MTDNENIHEHMNSINFESIQEHADTNANVLPTPKPIRERHVISIQVSILYLPQLS